MLNVLELQFLLYILEESKVSYEKIVVDRNKRNEIRL